ncbi:MAG TPA: phage tail sheath C-terminal domain-containing protein [Allosphingosinicella sp.]|nr:phage tail sheath C-terminal domain-containing protein [Allosphingosinicella sp.]
MRAGEALPGIRLEPLPPPQAGRLPRMDVAVFAGFAQRGPCHVAIPIASVAGYETVFGGDLDLAWDPKAGAPLRANLPAAVRAFFSNGGHCCWVIRLAATEPLIEAIASAGGDPGGLVPAAPGLFELPGLLSRAATADSKGSAIAPARLSAASLGAWSDSLRLTARVARQKLALANLARLRLGIGFTDNGMLSPGDLVEFVARDGLTTRYAKVARLEDGKVLAAWVAAFRRAREAAGPYGVAVLIGEIAIAATLVEGPESTLLLSAPAPGLLRSGAWLQLRHGEDVIWLRTDSVDGLRATGPAWRQIGFGLPTTRFSAAKVTLDIRESASGRTFGGLSPAPEGANAVQSIADDDAFYGVRANRGAAIRPPFALMRDEGVRIAAGYAAADPLGFAGAAARFGTDAFTKADRIALHAAWLPIGLDEVFGEAPGPLDSAAESLERDGLKSLDHRLFLDPRLAEGDAQGIAERAASLLHVEEKPLFGIHAAFDIEGDLFPEPSLLAVPDSVQPGWTVAVESDPAPPPRPGSEVPANWRNHSGGCLPDGEGEKLGAPDRGRFLDSTTQRLAAPMLEAPAQVAPGEAIELSWDEQPAGSIVVLEESGRADFATAAEVLRGAGAVRYVAEDRPQGLLYYRSRVEREGNVSAYSSVVVSVRGSRYQAVPADPALLRRLHSAMLRMAGGSGDFFAILSLPRLFRSAEATKHASALRDVAPGAGDGERLGNHEERLLSYGAVYHPWLAARGGAAFPPDGSIAGTMAARARRRGAWIAPANEPLLEIVGLDPALPEAEFLTLDRARINLVRRLADGFAVRDSDTLSNEPDWRQISVRRLMTLLRRTVLRRGMTYVFEPNGDVLRRAVERDLGQMLDELQRRGAFAGATSAQSFRTAVHQDPDRHEAARLIVELAVAPSQPMRFLTLRLVPRGGRLTVMEDA